MNDGRPPLLPRLPHRQRRLKDDQRGGKRCFAREAGSDYQVVPDNPQDRPLLPVKWEDEVLIDKALPFGLRSAPKL